MYNYWKCRVSRRPKAVKKRWVVTVIETDAVVIRCGTWERAIRKAIKFQYIQSRTAGTRWTATKEARRLNANQNIQEWQS